jgi:hypothetical protein
MAPASAVGWDFDVGFRDAAATAVCQASDL